MAKHVSREDFWANVKTIVETFEKKEDDAAKFLAKLSEVRDEPVHEV